jgi:transcriptional regulator with XRE-family HTH domain
MSDYMTGAELQTLREGCGLSRDDFAGLCGVAARTVKHWENGRSGVPLDVANTAHRIDEMVRKSVYEGVYSMRIALSRRDDPPAEIVLMRYSSTEDLSRYRPDMEGMPTGVHGAIICHLRQAILTTPSFDGVAVRIVWMQSDIYEAWRAENKLTDSEVNRSRWAASQVERQAIPHKADQPPETTAGGMRAP